MVTVAPSMLLPCTVPPLSRRVQSPAAWILRLRKSITMAADSAKGFCTWQVLLGRHGLYQCRNGSLCNPNRVGMTLCPMRTWGGGAKCDTFFAMRCLGTCQKCPRGTQGAHHHGIGFSLRSLHRRTYGPSRSSYGSRDTARSARGEGISQPLFMKVTTQPRERLVIRNVWTASTIERRDHRI